MTNQEAIKILKDDYGWCDPHCNANCDACINTADGLAIEALEKQIPKKYDVSSLGSMRCGCCGEYVEYPDYKYCRYCGQKIDYSEVK